MSEANQDFDRLLEYLRAVRGFDFSGYKRGGLMRRIQKRMSMVHVEGYGAYIDYLEVHPDEFAQLFDTILINVTSFFRDAPVWDYLRQEILPRIIESKPPDQPIRVWSAGCASGEEAYTLAIVLSEVLGVEQACERTKIYATDIDEDALNQARQAAYLERDLGEMDRALVDKYFDRINSGERYSFRKELRRCVIFGRHDLLQDAPISRIDLLVSRNSLMYFNAESQTRILTRFHFALNDSGYLLLGKAETMLTRANLFTPVDLSRRVFRKVPKMNLRDRLLILAQGGGYEMPVLPVGGERLREFAFDVTPIAQALVDLEGTLVAANERARALFNLQARDVGRPVQDLELAYRPAELRALIDKARVEVRPVALKEVEWVASNGERSYFDVQVGPLLDARGAVAGVSVTFSDVTRHRRLGDELNRANQELEAAYEELQSTSEELETTNEELQSTVEELETTNEELQSTNEELETMNEELQSTNEELQTINDELRLRSDELNQVNAFMNSILSSLRSGVVVVDRNLCVQAWNARAEDLWGLRESEVQGKYVTNLDIGLPVDQLLQPLREVLATNGDDRQMLLPATNRRGRAIQCRTSFSPLRGSAGEVLGAILLMEEQRDGERADGEGDGAEKAS